MLNDSYGLMLCNLNILMEKTSENRQGESKVQGKWYYPRTILGFWNTLHNLQNL